MSVFQRLAPVLVIALEPNAERHSSKHPHSTKMTIVQSMFRTAALVPFNDDFKISSIHRNGIPHFFIKCTCVRKYA